MFHCVSIYMIDKSYGGPEEGGWWYTTGEPCLNLAQHTRIFYNPEEAYAYRDHLRATVLPELNEGRRSINSVLSEGQYAVIVDEDEYPHAFPTERPYYC